MIAIIRASPTALADAPAISVIMATWGRGRHILPSVLSVLEQDRDDWELLVVGDACSDDTEAALRPFLSPRLRWLNLPDRVGSQSGPNMAGIDHARAPLIAYLGHDDIWERFHLSSLIALFDARPEVDFAVAGGLFHLPPGIRGGIVSGLFAGDGAVPDGERPHFFPPSSFAHRRAVIDRIGGWRRPEAVSAPVDADLLTRARAAGMVFASTGRLSLHKFAAGHRYLSYLRPSSEEQAAILEQVRQPDRAPALDRLIAESQAAGRFMTMRIADFGALPPGEVARQNAVRKGIGQAGAALLRQGAVITPEASFCAMDWQDDPRDGIRWTRLNPRPKVLIPFRGHGFALMHIVMAHRDPAALAALRLACNGTPLACEPAGPVIVPVIVPEGGAAARRLYRACLPLLHDGPTILDLDLDPDQAPAPGRPGIGHGDISLVPAAPFTGKPGPVGRWAAARNRERLARLRQSLSQSGKESDAIP